MNPVFDVFSGFYSKTTAFLPNFFYGILVLAIGLVLSGIVKQFFLSLVSFLKLGKLLKQTKVGEEKDINIWINVLAELLKWVVIILFLVPTVEIWGLSKLVTVLNNLLFYLPNVIVAVVVSLVGYIFSNLAHDIVLHSMRGLESKVSQSLASLTRYTILVFTGLIALNQLGVAQDLIKILFTGMVSMFALAGGLAFGLGGQDTARQILKELTKNLKKK